MQPQTTKPRTLVVAAIFAGFIAFLYILSGLILMLLGVTSADSMLVAAAGGGLLLLGTLMLTAVYGLTSLQEWGRRLMSGLSIVSVAISGSFIYPGWPGRSMDITDAALQGLIAAAFIGIVAYLSRPAVRLLYARAP